MRRIDQARLYARHAKRSDDADAALMTAMRGARATGVAENNLFKAAGVQAAAAAHRDTIGALMKFCVTEGLDIFGDEKRPGTGALGEIKIMQIPRRERGR